MTRAGTRRRGRAKGPPLWTLAAALVVIAMASFTGATRVGGEVARLERAERLSFLLEARAYEQAALDSRSTRAGPRTTPRPGAPPPSARSSPPPWPSWPPCAPATRP